MLNNQQPLDAALSRVNEVGSIAHELFNMNEAAFKGNRMLLKSFADFFSAQEKARQGLENPVLSIAMVGTTSAGKSTIVNALSGRKVAPMERKETSAGVLRLYHNTSRSIKIKRTQGARWNVGTTNNISDAEIYRMIVDVYDKYKTFVKTAAAPEITVSGPLLWQTNKELLNLPENLSVEFVDLPGLKTLTDYKNLEVIQSALDKSFRVIAIDFNSVSNDRLELLLDELKIIIKAMHGNTESLLFILNKVDSVTSVDVPVETVINGGVHDGVKVIGLTDIIRQRLSLGNETDIKIIPFVGMLLYHIEQSLKKDDKGTIIGYDAEKLKELFNDCANVFARYEETLTDEEEDALGIIRKGIKRGIEIPLKELCIFDKLCHRLSHATEFYEELNNRICNSFTEVIIRPVMYDLNNNLKKLVADVTSYININKKSSKLDLCSERLGVLKMKMFLLGTNKQESFDAIGKELDAIAADVNTIKTAAALNYINSTIAKLRQDIGTRSLGYVDAQIEDINNSIGEITTNLQSLQGADKVIKYLNSIKDDNRSVGVFNGISSIPDNIKKRLLAEVITPFRTSIDNKKTRGEFIELASKTMPTVLAESLGSQYSALFALFYERFSTFEEHKQDMCWYKKASESYTKEWEDQTIATYDAVDVRMRDVLSKKTNLYFQLDTDTFIKVLNKYLRLELNKILKELKTKLRAGDTDLSVLINNLMNVKQHKIVMPDTLFMFTTPQGTAGDEISEGRSVLDHYKTHSCSSNDAVYKTVYDTYYIYKYENSKAVYLRWEAGIDSSFAPFWTIIMDWIKKSVASYMENIRESARQVAEMTSSILDDKINSVNANAAIDMNAFDTMGDKVQSMSNFNLMEL